MVAAVALWFISRAMLNNRLLHYITGNSAQVSEELESYNTGEAVFSVQGNLGVDKVFVQRGSGACGCKAYINEGLCGHVDACPTSLRRFAEGSRRLETPCRRRAI